MSTLDFYAKQLESFSDPARQAAMQKFLQLGWPTSKWESWKYTHSRVFQEKEFTRDTSNAFLFSNEQYVHKVSEVQPGLRSQEETFSLLNDALWTEKFLIRVPAKLKLDEVLRIKIRSTSKQHARFLKLEIELEPYAEANIILEYEKTEESFINLVIETKLNASAKLRFLHICQNEAMDYIHHAVFQASQSVFNGFELSLKAKWFRQNLEVHLEGKYARCELKGLYFGEADEHVDHHLCVDHRASHCKSQQFYRGILKDHAKAVFNGKVIVQKDAQKTDASQKNNNILLSVHAEIDTKPELEIYANDVVCSHGATVGELSQETLFYLQSRGIQEAEAKKILLFAFAKEVLGDFKDLTTSWVNKRLENF